MAMLVGIAWQGDAQTLKGIITDLQKHPVEGAYIYLPQKGFHSHSDKKGFFLLDGVDTSDTLVISHMTYETQHIQVQNISDVLMIRLVEKQFSLEEIRIMPQVNAHLLITDIDIQSNPVNSSQEILRKVPGLVIGQHAGGGKAEQIFLRGFDIDHGTDINITVDGMPVNMVSHAHGQGYADLHFLIPETIEKIDYGKGPYKAAEGNFTTAGYVGFQTKDVMNQSEVKIEAGSFNTARMLGLFNMLSNENESAYLASEFMLSDGPFISPQNFKRMNLMGKYTRYLLNHDQLSLQLSHFNSSWDASGQIPERAVQQGLITRFGAIDDTEGGFTGRNNFQANYLKHLDEKSWVNNTAYLSTYDFELYSNFTFFLNDPINGDQIRQKESRTLYGVKSEWNRIIPFGFIQAALGFRNDVISGNELSRTSARKNTLSNLALGDVNETNYYAYLNGEFSFGKWLMNPALRFDWFKFIYANQLLDDYSNKAVSQSIISPKLNVFYNHSDHLQLYLKTGKGFHSNDTRVVVAQNGEQVLPSAWGNDLGFIWKPSPKIILNAALWQLFMEQEFVYVGDEGVVEPGGRTQRAGVDFGFRIQLFQSIFLNNDVNYTYARSIDDPEGENFLPLAPDLTMMGGISYLPASGLYASLKYRMIKNRPANEDNSIVAKGYTIVDANAGYRWNNLTFGLIVENLLNSEWNETQFATETRLQNETMPVEEIHFIPGTPFSLKLSLSYKF
ncbi:MAG: TonB-dependent receptor plug domain-containing protein [Prolixibacteraceae bacterium]|nr:TonB-dependent receptor plug domain-containing protein [Prolixibacteraceae bacterium]